jgi:hypothetical protein
LNIIILSTRNPASLTFDLNLCRFHILVILATHLAESTESTESLEYLELDFYNIAVFAVANALKHYKHCSLAAAIIQSPTTPVNERHHTLTYYYYYTYQ